MPRILKPWDPTPPPPRRQGHWSLHLARRETHPRAREIVTPLGPFPSASLAAEAFGITRQTAARWARSRKPGWPFPYPVDRGRLEIS